MRSEQTPSEKKLWRALQAMNRDKAAHFRRQVAIGDWVYDFGDFSARLLIEVDGAVHESEAVKGRDAAKRVCAERAGFQLLRLKNDEVWERLDWVIDQVRACRAAPHPLPLPTRGRGMRNRDAAVVA